MMFWRDAVVEYGHKENKLFVELTTLTNFFERNGMYPKCLDAVVKEMTRTGRLKPMSEFMCQAHGWAGWGVDLLLRRPFRWGLSKLVAVPQDNVFIFPDLVQKKSREVLANHYCRGQHEATENILELATFRALCSTIVGSDLDLDLVVKQLQLDGKILLTEDSEYRQIVKICRKTDSKVAPLQLGELHTLRIQRVLNTVEQQIHVLSKSADSLTAEARKLVREQKKTSALHQLRKRKHLQQQIEKKSSCADTLHGIIHKIQDASSNEMVLKAYESGVDAIRHLTGNLSTEKVEKVLDNLQEVLEEQEDMGQALAGLELPGSEVSPDDLECELEALLSADRGDEGCLLQNDSPGKEALGQGVSSVDTLTAALAHQSLDDLPEVPSMSHGSKTTIGGKSPKPVSG